jgi:hypothetical protein
LTNKYPKKKVYQTLSPSQKIALRILEKGLEINTNANTKKYDEEKGVSWLSELARDLKGEVSRGTIDQYLDVLLDIGILSPGKEIMQRVKENNEYRWVRAYHIGNEFVDKMIDLYIQTHDINK